MNLVSFESLFKKDEVSHYRHAGKIYGAWRNKFYPVSPFVLNNDISWNKLKQWSKYPGDFGYFVPLHGTKFQNDVSNNCHSDIYGTNWNKFYQVSPFILNNYIGVLRRTAIGKLAPIAAVITWSKAEGYLSGKRDLKLLRVCCSASKKLLLKIYKYIFKTY